MSSIATPISRPPTRFAASVPSGIVGYTGFNTNESPQRSHAPTAAPTPTAAIELKLGIGARTAGATVPAAQPASTDECVDVRRAEPVVAIMRATHVDLREHVFVARLAVLVVDVDHRALDVEERDHLGAIGGHRQRVHFAGRLEHEAAFFGRPVVLDVFPATADHIADDE